MSSLDIKIIKKIFPIKTGTKQKEVLIFKDLNFSVTPGEFVCIFGPSGCGKTTLLNLISGIDTSFNGSLNISKNKELSYMFQSPRLFPWLTALENVKFPIKKKPNSEQTAKSLIKSVELEKFQNSYPGKLSGGMQRRVAMARAFSTNPKILLLDEPFISLDKNTAENLRKLLLKLWKKSKITIIFVTHDLNEAISLSDRIIFLSKLPSKIILDYKIKLSRPREIDSKKVQSLRTLLSSSVRNK